MTAFWEKLGEGLAGEWNLQVLTPALAFWGGGVLAWGWQHGWQRLTEILQLDLTAGLVVLVAGLFFLLLSNGLVQLLVLPVLRLFEGYWPGVFGRLRFWLAERVGRKLKEKETEWNELAGDYEQDKLDARQSERYARLDAELLNYPLDERLLMPTRLGNMLRAAEEYPQRCYGLEITVTWPRLWLLMPEKSQQELAAARRTLNERVSWVIWAALFLVWTIWVWWLVFPAALAVVAFYSSLLRSADIYTRLLRAVYDLHRFALYENLHWRLPESPLEEKNYGQLLTCYLLRNTAPNYVRFRNMPPNSD